MINARNVLLGDWYVTASGRRFSVLDPRAEDVSIEDVAHALSHVCRFGGHVRTFYSVAQHSVLVSCLVPRRLAVHALLHDAAEAYVGDVVRPLKRNLPRYEEIETRVQLAILDRFGLAPLGDEDAEVVKHWDNVALVTERRDLVAALPPGVEVIPGEAGYTPLEERIVPEAPERARLAFRERFLEVRP